MFRLQEKYSLKKHKNYFGFFNPLRTGKKYFKTLFWLLKDGLRHSKFSSFSVVLANFIGVSTGVLAFSLIVGFIKYHIEGNVISFKGFKPPEPPAGLEGLLLYGSLALAAGLVSAGLIFFSKWGILHICKSYQKNCVLRCIEQLTNNNFPEKSKLAFISPRHGLHHIPTVYCRYVAFSYRFFLEVSLPLITFLFTLVVLLYLDFLVTLSLIPFSAAYIVPLYKLNRKSAKTQGRYLTSIGEFGPWLRDITLKLVSSGNPYIRENISKLLYKSHELTDVTTSLYSRLILKFSADFLSRILLVICMVWLFLIFGNQVINNQRSWVSILIFIVALRFTGTSLQQVVARFVNISRFYPAVDTYRKFVSFKPQDKKDKRFENKKRETSRFDIVLRSPTIDGSLEKGQIQWGIPLLLFMPFIPTKATMETMIKNSVVSDVSVDFIISDAIYHTIELPIDSLTIRENILGPCKDQSIISEMEKNLDSIGVLSELKQLPIGLNTLCTNEIMNNLSEEAKFSICNVFALFVKTHMVVLNAKKFFQLASDFQKHFLSQMPDKFVILGNTEVTEFDHSILDSLYKSSFFAVTDAECIVGFGDYQWFKSQQEDIKVFLRERLSEKDKENQYRKNLFDDDSDFDDDI